MHEGNGSRREALRAESRASKIIRLVAQADRRSPPVAVDLADRQ